MKEYPEQINYQINKMTYSFDKVGDTKKITVENISEVLELPKISQGSTNMSELGDIFEQLKKSGNYSQEILELFQGLQKSTNKEEFFEKIAKKYQALLNRLDNAIEIPDLNAELPKEAPMLYKNWKAVPENKGKTAIDCLNELYGEYIQKGKEILYQDNLNHLDSQLLEAVKNHCKTRKLTTKNFILPKTARRKKEAELINPKNIKKIRNLDRQHRKT